MGRTVAHAVIALIGLVSTGASADERGFIPAPDLRAGDAWVFDRSVVKGVAGFSHTRLEIKVERVGDGDMVVAVRKGDAPGDVEAHMMGADWSQRRLVDGVQATTARPFSFPLALGKAWSTDYVDPTRYGLQVSAEHHETYKVTGWADVTTPAGTFHALEIEADDKIEAQMLAANGARRSAAHARGGATAVPRTARTGPHTVYAEAFSTFYYTPEIKYWVKAVREVFDSNSVRTLSQTDVLLSFTPAR